MRVDSKDSHDNNNNNNKGNYESIQTCIQISQEAGQVVQYCNLFKNFTQFIVIHTVKGFGIVNEAEISSWQIDGETVETVADFILGGSKITADGDCSHEIERRLLLGRKAMTYLDSTLRSKDDTLPTNVCLVKAMFFPVVIYGCESWTIKKAER